MRAQVAELSGRNAELGDDLGSALDMAQNAMQERGALQKQVEALQAQREESASQVGPAVTEPGNDACQAGQEGQ